MKPSSQDLHPTTGARFVFDRAPDRTEEAYDVVIYLPDGLRWSGQRAWTEGTATLEPDPDQPSPTTEPLAWAHAEALKLARTLRRTPKQHIVRWRG
jgi:hypothetical protein